MRAWPLCLIPCFLLVPASLRAQDEPDQLFEVRTADGATVSGPLERIRDDWSVALGGAEPKQIPGRDVIGLHRAGALRPAFPREEHLVLQSGDRIPGKLLEIRGERVRWLATFQGRAGPPQELTVPLSAVAVLWLAKSTGEIDPLRSLGRQRHDTVLLRNGDVLEGSVASADQKLIRLESGTDGRQTRVQRERVAALVLSAELARTPRPRGVYARLVLANGTRLLLSSLRADNQVLAGQTLFGAGVQLPVEQIVALDLLQGRAVYLSDLKPKRYEHTPYLDIHWPYTLDRSVMGNDLRLGGATYDKGIGLHSESRLTYDLAGNYQWFEAVVGLDDVTGREGSVRIEVLVDGRRQDLGPEEELTGQGPPRPVRCRVAGARELTLVVRFGQHGDVQDHVNWADARLIK
jgi:hypothetical protein